MDLVYGVRHAIFLESSRRNNPTEERLLGSAEAIRADMEYFNPDARLHVYHGPTVRAEMTARMLAERLGDRVKALYQHVRLDEERTVQEGLDAFFADIRGKHSLTVLHAPTLGCFLRRYNQDVIIPMGWWHRFSPE